MTFHNNEFAALWDHYKVFRLSKNNLVSLTTENGIFESFLYGSQTFLVPKSIISTRATISENFEIKLTQ